MLGEWNLRQFWNITSGIYAKYHVQILLLFVYTTTRKRFVIFTCRYFKLRWNTTALSQSKSPKIRIVARRRFWRFLLVNKLPLSIMAVHAQYRDAVPLMILPKT